MKQIVLRGPGEFVEREVSVPKLSPERLSFEFARWGYVEAIFTLSRDGTLPIPIPGCWGTNLQEMWSRLPPIILESRRRPVRDRTVY